MKIFLKFEKIFLSLILIAVTEITYFYWQPYDKCLIQPSIIIDKLFVLDLLSRFIYYLLFFSVIIFVLSMLFEKKIFKTNNTKKIPSYIKFYLIAFGTRVLFDVLEYFISRIFVIGSISILVNHIILESIFNILTIVICIRILFIGDLAKKTKTRTICLYISIVAIIILLVCLLIEYVNCFELINIGKQTWIYKLYFCNLYRDILICFSTILIAYMLLKHKDYIGYNLFKSFFVMIIRILSIVLLFCLINYAKFIILPHSLINSIYSVDNEIIKIERITSYYDAHDNSNWF